MLTDSIEIHKLPSADLTLITSSVCDNNLVLAILR